MERARVGRRTVLAGLTAGALAGCGRAAALSSGGQTVASPPSPSPAMARTGTARTSSPAVATPAAVSSPSMAPGLSRAEVVARYGQLRPDYWGFGGPGVVRDLHTTRRVIALTFDACGGPGGSEYDAALIEFLRQREVPATLFLNSRWIDENPAVFRRLRGEPLFELANHGTRHLPLSVTGRSAYGIGGTRDAGEVYDEVATNQVKLTRLLGTPPRYFRAGTAYSDDVAAQIVTAMTVSLVTFSVNGDGGATFTPGEVRSTVAAAPAGSIVLGHMNHPSGGTAQGIAAAVPQLAASGYRFVRLSDDLS
ncbi:MAG TPA: polysaccharide deacetylase family protein [Streptosporangiaceae bacterium]